jgi:hypothetical protein
MHTPRYPSRCHHFPSLRCPPPPNRKFSSTTLSAFFVSCCRPQTLLHRRTPPANPAGGTPPCATRQPCRIEPDSTAVLKLYVAFSPLRAPLTRMVYALPPHAGSSVCHHQAGTSYCRRWVGTSYRRRQARTSAGPATVTGRDLQRAATSCCHRQAVTSCHRRRWPLPLL